MECSHIGKVLEWGFDENHDFKATLWGCVLCDASSETPFKADDIFIDHNECGEDCFGCKAKGLQLNTGDASRDIPDKAWNAKLQKYRNARANGIQPGGTSEHMVEAAIKASEVMNKPYDGNTMIPAHKITTGVAGVMKEIGDI